jgi:hypothetical protein
MHFVLLHDSQNELMVHGTSSMFFFQFCEAPNYVGYYQQDILHDMIIWVILDMKNLAKQNLMCLCVID